MPAKKKRHLLPGALPVFAPQFFGAANALRTANTETVAPQPGTPSNAPLVNPHTSSHTAGSSSTAVKLTPSAAGSVMTAAPIQRATGSMTTVAQSTGHQVTTRCT